MSLAIDYDERNRQWRHYRDTRARIQNAKKKISKPKPARLYAGPIGPELPGFALSSIKYAIIYGWPIGPNVETAVTRARRIRFEIAHAHGFTVDELLSHRREHRLVAARQEAMARVFEGTRWSLPQIGRFFDRDHTTVLHAVRKFGHCPPRGGAK